MSDYTQTTDFSAKDDLASGNPSKLIKGADFDTEFSALATAIATKYDSSDIASQAQAEAEASNAVLMSPLAVAYWADANGGMVGDIQALADPGADALLGWDDSAGAAIGFTAGTGLAFSGTAFGIDTGVVPQLSANNTFTQEQTFTGAASASDGSITLASASPGVRYEDSSGGADAKNWLAYAASGEFKLSPYSDADSAGTAALKVVRSGNTISEIELNATTLDFNGVADFSGNVTAGGAIKSTYVTSASNGSFHAVSNQPGQRWEESDAALDEKIWIDYASAGVRVFSIWNDALGASDTWMRVLRSGVNVSEVEINAPTLDFNGALAVSGSIRSEAGSFLTSSNSNPHYGLTTSEGTSYFQAVEGSRVDISTATGLPIHLRTNGSTRVTIAADGSEIDLTATTLDFNGAADFSGDVTVRHANQPQLDLIDTTNSVNTFIAAGNTEGYVGTISAHDFAIQTNNTNRIYVESDGSEIQLDATLLDFNGALSADTSAANTVGYLGAPSRNVTATGNTAASDAGGSIKFTSGSSQTFTLNSDPPADSIVVLINKSGNDWTIAASTTLIWAVDGSTGSRTLADDGMAVAFHDGSGTWYISGGGLS